MNREKLCRLGLPAFALAALALACGYEPEAPVIEYDLAESTKETLAGDPAARAQVRGALEMLFGTPEAPRYLLVEDWVDDEHDPNLGGLVELSDEEWEELVADNREHFRRSLAAVEAGDFEAIHVPREATDLRARIEGILADRGEVDVEEIREELTIELEEWYPTLRESAELYRVQCLHCHGPEGGGDGPTAPYLEPPPRDYRLGKFKFTALDDKARPRRQDLVWILQEGVYTTAMPSFARFSRAQLEGLADYVRLLSIRGETEGLLALDYDSEDVLPLETIRSDYLLVWQRWEEAEEEVIVYEGEIPEMTPERIAHGREIFLGENLGNCASCHGVDGRGGGPSAFEVDQETGELERVKDDWGNQISPRDLTAGLYRGGSRPIDLYRRIYAGINGTPMPSHSAMRNAEGERLITDEDIWDVVFYVYSLADRGEHSEVARAAGDDSAPEHGSH